MSLGLSNFVIYNWALQNHSILLPMHYSIVDHTFDVDSRGLKSEHQPSYNRLSFRWLNPAAALCIVLIKVGRSKET